ncbi:LPS-assembly protein LptD [Nitrosovibrio tenuis]|uniref:LPS-assembly protein LptD n=1 Tax=Nitrosovibrio tenuis TaxID=1233 RepID=A0A1H7N995_9PROT|nr:LPS-assembly protein LptD [Nitrosovibrio tenuis]SEL19558.1 LPS-assembly protein [Nitrosovibrio tenuis]
MKSRFSRPVCWSVLLFCLACDVRAETPSTESKNKQERVARPAQKETNGNKPVLIDTEPIRGRHEYETEAKGDADLRSSSVISAEERPDNLPESIRPKPQQNYTSPAVKNAPAKNEPTVGVSAVDAEHKENQPVTAGVESVAEHALHEGEPALRTTTKRPSGIAATPPQEGSRLAMPGPEMGKNRFARTETDQIRGHFEQESDFKLRLGGQVEPDTGTRVGVAGAPVESAKNKPIFVAADRLQGHPGRDIEAIGKAELTNGDQFISADRMKYYETTEDAEAEGAVRVEQRGDILEGSRLKFNLASKTGELSQPSYQLKDASSRGSADLLRFEGENKYRLQHATYTTCPAGDESWFIQVTNIVLDNSTKTGTARGVKLTFKDVPLFYTPWMSFSYGKERKSGLLAPTYGTNVKTGLELTLPFYWNIAPNYDATISARMMSKRGVALNNEFRYLTKYSSGTALLDVLPYDLDTKHNRWRTSFWHDQNLTNGWWSRLDYNRVSDDNYFRDLGNNLNLTSRTNLLQQGVVGYNRNLGEEGTLSLTAMAQQFQTIQDPLATIVAPYKRLPQATLIINKPNVFGADFNFLGSGTNFSHPTLVSGQRLVLFPSVSYPMQSAFGYITPKIGIHHTRYYLDALGTSPESNPTRTLPLFSVDTGVMLDRNIALRGEQFTQTLEPRLFYVYVPFRDQSSLPNFDSAKTDFSFAQMLTENRFSGSDRINDANQVTFALTSRLIEPGSGKERLRLAVGQQVSFTDRRISLDAPNTISRRPDFIAAVSGFITPTISTDSSMQFDQRMFRTEVVRSGLSYRPEPGKVINVGYRFTRDVLHQVDASSQWRWAEKWQTVARINYSLQDHRILEGLAGLEYNSCCWSLRFVVQHLTTATQRTTTAAFLQLELNGLMQIGSNPLQVLQRSIPGYTQIGSQGSSPVEGPQSGEHRLSQ